MPQVRPTDGFQKEKESRDESRKADAKYLNDGYPNGDCPSCVRAPWELLAGALTAAAASRISYTADGILELQ
jgi:hypothetical protein